MDYKTQNPDAYWEIMNLLFKPNYGAGLTHIKIEFGSDVNSSSGTEPSIMRSAGRADDKSRHLDRPAALGRAKVDNRRVCRKHGKGSRGAVQVVQGGY